MSNYSQIIAAKSWNFFNEDVELQKILEADVLPKYIKQCRWFGGKSSKLEKLSFEHIISFPAKDDVGYLLILKTVFNTGKSDFYLLPVTLVYELKDISHKAIIAEINYNHKTQFMIDGIYDIRLRESVFTRLVNEEDLISGDVKIVFRKGKGMDKKEPADSVSKVLDAEQSNSSIIYNDKYFFKLYRKLFPAINPDVETISFLTEAGFKYIPSYAGSVSLQVK
ncbi:MAG: hypothetical protein LH629_04135, partial [Ignavibacteria bacterium]|nr:hypothetical protein [Ignavibacteria bacterium]